MEKVWHGPKLQELVISINKGDFPKAESIPGRAAAAQGWHSQTSRRWNTSSWKITERTVKFHRRLLSPPRGGSPPGASPWHRGHTTEPPPAPRACPGGCELRFAPGETFPKASPFHWEFIGEEHSLLSPWPGEAPFRPLTGDRSRSGWEGH